MRDKVLDDTPEDTDEEALLQLRSTYVILETIMHRRKVTCIVLPSQLGDGSLRSTTRFHTQVCLIRLYACVSVCMP